MLGPKTELSPDPEVPEDPVKVPDLSVSPGSSGEAFWWSRYKADGFSNVVAMDIEMVFKMHLNI